MDWSIENPIGVMQGRLLPKYKGRYQAHPVGYWQEEFPVAKEQGLDCIEFIFDYNEVEKNPLFYDGGLDEILAITESTGVKVTTICADYFMRAPLHSPSEVVVNESRVMLNKLIDSAQKLGVTDIVIPCVDDSALDEHSVVRLQSELVQTIDVLEQMNVNLSLETNLAPAPYFNLLEYCKSDKVTVNYDTGNSASLGYDPREEFSAYGARISDVHIKDRTYSGGSVLLGSGDTNFDVIFSELQRLGYHGPIIMQAYRNDEGVDIFKQQFGWIRSYLVALN